LRSGMSAACRTGQSTPFGASAISVDIFGSSFREEHGPAWGVTLLHRLADRVGHLLLAVVEPDLLRRPEASSWRTGPPGPPRCWTEPGLRALRGGDVVDSGCGWRRSFPREGMAGLGGRGTFDRATTRIRPLAQARPPRLGAFRYAPGGHRHGSIRSVPLLRSRALEARRPGALLDTAQDAVPPRAIPGRARSPSLSRGFRRSERSMTPIRLLGEARRVCEI
jgi:hypothetical protein